MDNNMKKELCIHAFQSACRAQGASEMILHSDRGSQFTSADFRKVLARYSAIQSMSGTGRCYDNACMESFFATLKKEKLYQLQTEKLPMAQVKALSSITLATVKPRLCSVPPESVPRSARECYFLLPLSQFNLRGTGQTIYVAGQESRSSATY